MFVEERRGREWSFVPARIVDTVCFDYPRIQFRIELEKGRLSWDLVIACHRNGIVINNINNKLAVEGETCFCSKRGGK